MKGRRGDGQWKMAQGDDVPVDEVTQAIAARYARFAEQEARGRSPLYQAITEAIATDTDVLGFIATIPPAKQQPNLLLAAMRHRFGVAADYTAFRSALLGEPDAVRAIMMTHATQTNEPGRCATLLPLLARLPQPLALIEVGASAGLCLLPDHYNYHYMPAGVSLPAPTGNAPNPDAPTGSAPTFTCHANDATPIPATMPRIIWRAGLDLNPLDATDPEHRAWLRTLIWPEQTERAARLDAALAIAARHKPPIRRGSLLGDDLADLCRQAPPEATLVIFHTAVVAYVDDPAARHHFAATARNLAAAWISNEAPGVFPDIARRLPSRGPSGHFLLSLNGDPVAWTDPHGARIDWL
jgi:hypothetical protein